MVVISGTAQTLPRGLHSKLACYRHRVFVGRLGWQLSSFGQAEQDRFDRPDSLYLAEQDEDGQLFGCARLLPTTRPCLLAEVFPQLLNGQPCPCSPDIWELSRFASVAFNTRLTSSQAHYSSSTAVPLLRASLACAAKHGAKRLISVSPIGVERLLRKVNVRRAGPPMMVDRRPIAACWIAVPGYNLESPLFCFGSD